MDCITRLLALNTIVKSSKYDLRLIFKQIRDGLYRDEQYKQLTLALNDLINALNDPSLIECINLLKGYTTNPSIYDILDFILLTPGKTIKDCPTGILRILV